LHYISLMDVEIVPEVYVLHRGGYVCMRNISWMVCLLCCSDVQPWLIFSNRYYIRRLSVDGHYYDILTQTLHNVVALDYDLSHQQLYFIDARQKKLFRMMMNGTGMEAVIWQGLHSPEGLAVDWIGRYVFTLMFMSRSFSSCRHHILCERPQVMSAASIMAIIQVNLC